MDTRIISSTSVSGNLSVDRLYLSCASDDNSDIMSASEEGTCLHVSDERRMLIMNEVHDLMSTLTTLVGGGYTPVR